MSLSVLNGPARPELIRAEVLADLFEATAQRIPASIALECGGRRLSYLELNDWADRVATRLMDAGAGPGRMVGLWMPRGIELLVMQLGIAKTGAAWLPFDAETPVDRVKVCLDDAQAVGLVSVDERVPACGELTVPVWTAELLSSPLEGPVRRREGVKPEDPAYTIYTSGSTGKPKGIQIHQGAICHFLRSENEVLGVREGDRVYQGFSVAFDMSFEEIWISYLVGATLWIAPREVTADPDALPQALIEQGITVLHAVPTLLALFSRDIPGLRIINLGGEACPESLVQRWARPGRQVFNTYGPTEATVSASLAELHAGEPVTIGKPLPNYGLLVIDPEVERGLRLLPLGETGELCITGPGVAHGYLGRPDLTAEKFLTNPWAEGEQDKRLYRTGDLARIDEHGQVRCLGRTDDQVKIRGFRVELGEIEVALARQPGVGTAAVLLRNDDGLERLVAYMVADRDPAPTPAELRAALAAALPPYMVPVHWEFLDEMPRLISGKIDRKSLRARPIVIAAGAAGESDLPETPAEEVLFAALAKLFPGQPIRRDADFFSDLGGHSLFAARLASAVRTDPRFATFTVRDVYAYRNIGRIAQEVGLSVDSGPAVDRDWVAPPDLRRWICGLAQLLVVPFLVVLRMAQWLVPFFTYHLFTGDQGDSIPLAVGISVGVFLISSMLSFVFSVAGKWLIAGRIKPGRYPLWGWTYFRWWLADRLVESAPTYMLSGSPLYTWWLRSLGAKVGSEVTIGSVSLRAHDLLTIADGASIGNAVNFENVRVEHGELIIGTISVGEDAYVGSYAVLEGNTVVEERAHLDGQSALCEGERVPAWRVWSGSPARDTGRFDPSIYPPRRPMPRFRRVLETGYYSLGVLGTAAVFFLPVFPTFILVDLLDNSTADQVGSHLGYSLLDYFLIAFPATGVLIVCTVLLSALLRWTLLPRLRKGRWSVHSSVYYARWLVNQIQESSLIVLHGVYATVYAPFWYRLMGAKVGREAEISTATGLVPDVLELGDETFIADAVMLGDEEVDAGWMTIRPTVVSRRSFVGNGAFVPCGSVLPENVLIGVHSRVPENDRMNPGDTWLGTPPMHLPAREETKGFPESLTFNPSRLRRLGRALVEAFRIITPHATIIAVGYMVVLIVMPAVDAGRWGEVVWVLNAAGLSFGMGTFVFIALLKWLLIGRYDKRSQPMWTPFVWLSEGVTSLYEGITVPSFMRYLRGTPWLPLAFNALGCHMGKGVYLDTTDITEFDCVHVGDYSELNALTCPQTHLFEDRVMKIDHVHIGSRVTMGARSTVLYSASVGDHVQLGPLTLVMKGESIPAASRWRGCPAAPVRG